MRRLARFLDPVGKVMPPWGESESLSQGFGAAANPPLDRALPRRSPPGRMKAQGKPDTTALVRKSSFPSV